MVVTESVEVAVMVVLVVEMDDLVVVVEAVMADALPAEAVVVLTGETIRVKDQDAIKLAIKQKASLFGGWLFQYTRQ